MRCGLVCSLIGCRWFEYRGNFDPSFRFFWCLSVLGVPPILIHVWRDRPAEVFFCQFTTVYVTCSIGFTRLMKHELLRSAEEARSTIEVNPNFSEAPHLRSSTPHPKTDFGKKYNASWQIVPWPKSTKSFFFKTKIEIPTIWGLGTPSIRNKIAEMCYLYRRTGQS